MKRMCYTILEHNTNRAYPFERAFSQLPDRSDQKMEEAMQPIKIIVEKHANGYVAYPLGLKGVVVGEGDTYGEALDDVKSAIRFHIETFGPDIFDTDSQVLETFVAETEVAL